jgi:Carboxypeptidase regulatory-like domain
MSYDNCALRVILVASMLAVVAFAAQTVNGHVVNSVTGIDIAGVAVKLVQAGEVAYSATTDAQGQFRIEAVKAGAYTASYLARGFWPIPNLFVDEDFERECGRCFIVERGGQPFQVAAGGDPVRLEVRMAPIGKISGRVLDYLDEPVANASLQLHWGESWFCKMPSCSGISRQTKTNEKGEYTVTDLDVPGAWLLSAIAPSSRKPPESRDGQRLDWVQTFYPGVTDPQLAVRVMVRTGGEISNLDIKLAAVPVHRIRGVVLDVSGNRVPKATVTLGKGVGSTDLTRNTRSDGTFEFETVAEGEWRISTNVDSGVLKLWAAQLVQLRAHDLENLELRPAAPFAIQGKIVMEVPEGVLAPQPPSVVLAFTSGAAGFADRPAGAFLTGIPDAKGDFQIRNVYPGPYQILPGPAPAQYYVDSIRIGGHDALESGVEILPGAQPLTVAYKFGGGTVRGTVEKCAGGTVRLLPHDKAMWRQGFELFAPCDSNDRYAITAVRPGDYYALVIAGDSPIPWYATTWEDDGLVNNASTVTVRAGETSSADLRAIKP